MSSSRVIAAPFLSLFRRRCVEQNGLQILVAKVLTPVAGVSVVSVVAVVRMTVAMLLSRGPDVQRMQGKGREATEQQAGAGNVAEAAKRVVTISPARRPYSHCLDQRRRLVGHLLRLGRRPVCMSPQC